MAIIHDHRPRTAGAGPGFSAFQSAGIGAQAAQEYEAEAQRIKLQAEEAARQEQAHQRKIQAVDLQILEAETAIAERRATRQAEREALQTGGNRYQQTAERLSPTQKAWVDRAIANPDVDPVVIARQMDQ